MPGPPVSPGPPAGPGASHSYDAAKANLTQNVLDEASIHNAFSDELSQRLQSTIDEFVVEKTGVVPTLVLGRPV